MALILVFVVPSALAVHDEGVFQLDGNAFTSDTTNAVDADPGPGTDYGDDWDRVCYERAIEDGLTPAAAATLCGTNEPTSGATAVSWEAELDRNATIFTSGGSKDPQDLSSWLWKDGAGGLPDKDNLLHAFAARYSNGDELLYFGSDRFDNSGDAVQGFWFLQAPLAADGASSQGGFKFTDGEGGTPEHTVGDLLVISDFSNGGDVSTINIYEWVASGGDTTTHLDFVDGGANALCSAALSNDNFCGIVNPAGQSPTDVPWSFLDKSGSADYLNGEFFEAGINLSNLGFGDQCFSTVVAETRASTSPTATLKDFVVGSFGGCGSELATTPKDGTGGALTDSADPEIDGSSDTLIDISIGSGSVTVTDSAMLTVSGVQSWSGTLTFHLCGPISSGLCDTGGVEIASTVPNPDNTTTMPVLSEPATLTSAGRYCWRADFVADNPQIPPASDSTATECFEVLPVQTNLDTQAVASPVDFGQAVQDNATLGGTVTQPGTNGPNATYPTINATNGAAAGGKITFTLLKNNCTDPATGTGTNPQDYTPISGNGTYGPVSFTPDAPGTYHWKAQYFPAAGDPNNLGSSHNANCGDSDETVIVRQIPTSISTTQSVFPNDSATITSTVAGDNLPSGGTVVFSLFDNATCSDPAGATGLLYTETKNNVGGANSVTVGTNNTSIAVSASGTYSWLVTYAPGDQAHTGRQSACHVEHFDITFTNDAGPGTLYP